MTALDGVSMDLAEGECLCLLGPSGCGKSTLLRVLAGFEPADEGAVELEGQNMTGLPPHRRPLNMMFQSYALFPHLTVRGNVAYGLKRAGLGRTEVAARVAELLRLVRLDGLESRYPAQISGGQRQRVALARALARRPRVLLLDEPLGALDRRLREATQAELKSLQARLRTAMVVVTHDQEEAMVLGDRIGIMEAGQLVQVGIPRHVYERPATRFAAGFLGDVNLLEGRIAGREGGRWRVTTDAASSALLADGPDAAVGQAVALAVRPERMTLGGDAAENAVPVRIVELQFRGALTACRAELPSGQMLKASWTTAGQDRVEIGDRLHLGFPAGAAWIVDR